MTMRTLRLLLLLSAWMVGCLCVCYASGGQESAPAGSGADVAAAATGQGLPARLAWRLARRGIGPVYGPRRHEVLYLGEPAEFVVELSTEMDAAQPIRLPRPAEALLTEGTWGLRKLPKEAAKAVKIRLRRFGRAAQAKHDTVPAGDSIGFDFDLPDIREHGKYRLDFKPLGSRSPVATLDFEVVQPATKQEQMEWHRRSGMRLSWAGKYQEAEGEFEALLKMNPNSASAYAELSMIREGQGRLREAIAYVQKAIAIAEAHADPYTTTTRNGDEDWAGYLRLRRGRLNEKTARDGKRGP